MEKRKFGRTGLSVTPVGLGAAPIGILHVDQERSKRLLDGLLDAGVNLIDTAAVYKESEELIGQAVAHRRDQFVLVSKCGNKVDDIDAPAWSAELVHKTVDRALRRLRTEYLDVMLLHTCDLPTLERGEALGALVEAREAGKVRHIGYSGDNEAAAWAAAHGEVEVIEISVNIVDQHNIEHVLPIAIQHNVGVLAKRPIANAAWKEPAVQPGFYKTYAAPYSERLQKMGVTLQQLGFSGDAIATWPEVALRFTLSQSGVHCAIVGTTSLENAQNNIAAARKGALPKEAVEKLRAAFTAAEQRDGQPWRGLT